MECSRNEALSTHMSFTLISGFASDSHAIPTIIGKKEEKEKAPCLVKEGCFEFQVAEEEGFEPSLPLKR